MAEAVDEVEARPRHSHGHGLLCVAARQRVGDGVRAALLVLDGEVKAEKLAHPVVLWDGGQALIQQKFKTVMVSP